MKRGKPKEGETRKLTLAEFKKAGLDCGMWIRGEADGKFSFWRLTSHGYGKTYTEKDLKHAEKRLKEYWE